MTENNKQAGDIIEGVIEKLAFPGVGILRMPDRFVVFVPFTAVAEKVRCRLVKIKKNYAEAELLDLLTESPDRVKPLCPYFTRCGGCQLQHLNYKAQLDYKHNAVLEALKPVYPDAAIEIQPADPIWAYRRHIILTLKPQSKGFKLGYIGIDHSDLIEVEQCPIFCAKEDPIVAIAKAIAEDFESTGDLEGKLMLAKGQAGNYLLLFHFNHMPKNAKSTLEKAFKKYEFQAISATSPRVNHSFGKSDLEMQIDMQLFTYHPQAFMQNHPEQSVQIYKTLLHAVAEFKPKHLIDLYSGIGITSLLAAPYAAKVTGIESNVIAVEKACINALNKGFGHVGFIQAKVEECIPKWKQADMIIMNPPRIGLHPKVAESMQSSQAAELIYVSCHAATLARDLRILKSGGFEWKQGYAFDMFPQTGHVESLIKLKRAR